MSKYLCRLTDNDSKKKPVEFHIDEDCTANLNIFLQHLKEDGGVDLGKVSDGYHNFDELYHQKAILFAIICNQNKLKAWKSYQHHSSDDEMYDGHFIAGINTPLGQYTFHLPVRYWDMFHITHLQGAPKWDGHKPSDIARLLSL